MNRFCPALLELQRCIFSISFFCDAITPGSVRLVCLSIATPLIISPREHTAQQHDNPCGCDQRAYVVISGFKQPLEVENTQHTDT